MIRSRGTEAVVLEHRGEEVQGQLAGPPGSRNPSHLVTEAEVVETVYSSAKSL